MSTPQAAGSLVYKLPQRLRNFFARYPPQIYSAAVAPRPEPTEEVNAESLPSPYTPNRDAKGHKRPDPTEYSPSRAILYSNPDHPNPFLPRKNFRTGKWIGPRYGLRTQADLVKLAKKYNVEALLPPGRKSTEFKETRREERGLQIKGTGIGQKVKGHKWERTMESRLEERRKAMMEMPEMIRLWKQVSFQFQSGKFPHTLTLWLTERSRSWLEAMAQEVNAFLATFYATVRFYVMLYLLPVLRSHGSIDHCWGLDGSSCSHICTNRYSLNLHIGRRYCPSFDKPCYLPCFLTGDYTTHEQRL
ncbi:unnamed protein product [Aspergillus oryzae var. brunneus]|uniref:Unnamed protein product n=1 Tax=Aspergillus oryzae var. brunneus TaxID=332754 RepID=A0ABQ6KQ26_ASPOZ|nr:unnamed protein product [Aspergillus oryzae var. brunneus]